MIILSLQFWFALILFIGIYYTLPTKWQNEALIVANLLFLFALGPQSFIVCLFSILLQYLFYKVLKNPMTSPTARHRWIICAVVLQTSVLVLFKTLATKNQPLPIGVSYYSFALIGFSLNVYWKRVPRLLNLKNYFLAASFFPTLLMGPIDRIEKIALQMVSPRRFSLDSFKMAAYYILLGLFKITAIANPLSDSINHQRVNALQISGISLFAYCALGFLKLYAEFSGFIDIVTGISLCLGIKITKNFDQPYFARSFADIWKRWHISLSLWMKDFIFHPILLKTRNMTLAWLSVIVLIGAWHGLTIGYFYWTAYWSGIFTASFLINKIEFIRSMTGAVSKSSVNNFFAIPFTFTIISLSTLCFMTEDVGLTDVLARLIRGKTDNTTSFHVYLNLTSFELYLILFAILTMVLLETTDRKTHRPKNGSILLTEMVALVFLISALGKFDSTLFSYINF